MNINPVLDKILVKKCNFDDIYKSSIILSNLSKNNLNKLIYEVVEVGPGGIVNGVNVNITVKPGDKVIVPEFIGSEILIDSINYRIIKQDDILGILEN